MSIFRHMKNRLCKDKMVIVPRTDLEGGLIITHKGHVIAKADYFGVDYPCHIFNLTIVKELAIIQKINVWEEGEGREEIEFLYPKTNETIYKSNDLLINFWEPDQLCIRDMRDSNYVPYRPVFKRLLRKLLSCDSSCDDKNQ